MRLQCCAAGVIADSKRQAELFKESVPPEAEPALSSGIAQVNDAQSVGSGSGEATDIDDGVP